MTFEETLATFMAESDARDKALGLAIRCPTCDAGIGKFCLKGMNKETHVRVIETHVRVIHRTADQIIRHPERVALANAQ